MILSLFSHNKTVHLFINVLNNCNKVLTELKLSKKNEDGNRISDYGNQLLTSSLINLFNKNNFIGLTTNAIFLSLNIISLLKIFLIES